MLLALTLPGCSGLGPETPVVRGDIAGTPSATRSKHKDVVFDIARKHDLGVLEVLGANPDLDLWVPGRGTRVVLPTAHIFPRGKREGIIVNIAELRLYDFKDGRFVMSAPIGIGREGYKTPLGVTKVIEKRKDPVWHLTASERRDHPELPAAVPPGPDNPLGAYAMRLGWTKYLIHGTNTPDGVGQWASRGCIRLYPEDIERLYSLTAVGTPVRIVNQPLKLATYEGELFLQVHPLKQQFDELSLKRRKAKIPLAREESWIKAHAAHAGKKAADLDWPVIRAALKSRTGLPVQITGAPEQNRIRWNR